VQHTWIQPHRKFFGKIWTKILRIHKILPVLTPVSTVLWKRIAGIFSLIPAPSCSSFSRESVFWNWIMLKQYCKTDTRWNWELLVQGSGTYLLSRLTYTAECCSLRRRLVTTELCPPLLTGLLRRKTLICKF